MAEAKQAAEAVNQFGYRSFALGVFKFERDEYFAHINWPGGSHTMSVETFLRALIRDLAWNFFYGMVNFDHVFGTTNHYGNVDVFTATSTSSPVSTTPAIAARTSITSRTSRARTRSLSSGR